MIEETKGDIIIHLAEGQQVDIPKEEFDLWRKIAPVMNTNNYFQEEIESINLKSNNMKSNNLSYLTLPEFNYYRNIYNFSTAANEKEFLHSLSTEDLLLNLRISNDLSLELRSTLEILAEREKPVILLEKLRNQEFDEDTDGVFVLAQQILQTKIEVEIAEMGISKGFSFNFAWNHGGFEQPYKDSSHPYNKPYPIKEYKLKLWCFANDPEWERDKIPENMAILKKLLALYSPNWLSLYWKIDISSEFEQLLKNLSEVEILDLSFIGDYKMEGIFQLIGQYLPQLHIKVLKLFASNKEGIEAISEGLAQNSTLESLEINLDNNTPDCYRKVSKGILKSNTLRSLILRIGSVARFGSQLEPTVYDFLELYKHPGSINSLNLVFDIRESGIYIKQILALNPNIRTLIIKADNGRNPLINDEGCRYIAQGMKEGGSLEYLELGSNTITDKGVEYIAEAMHYCPKLKNIHFLNQLGKITYQNFSYYLSMYSLPAPQIALPYPTVGILLNI